MEHLLDAHYYAGDLGTDLWEFALDYPSAVGWGMSRNDCRWLAARGFIELASEVTDAGDTRRRFLATSGPVVTDKTCLVLTEEGARLARQVLKGGPMAEASVTLLTPPSNRQIASAIFEAASHQRVEAAEREPALRPLWDAERRELRVGAALVKSFRVPAPNQEVILATFEEEHWPPRIDDPLPVRSRVLPKRRLHDAISALNRHHRKCLLRFSADGRGKGVRWEFIAPAASDPSTR